MDHRDAVPRPGVDHPGFGTEDVDDVGFVDLEDLDGALLQGLALNQPSFSSCTGCTMTTCPRSWRPVPSARGAVRDGLRARR